MNSDTPGELMSMVRVTIFRSIHPLQRLGSHSLSRCTAVAPGIVATDILAIMPEDFKQAFFKGETPFVAAEPRLGEPDDIAQVVAFLSSEGARWISGSTVNASGGRYFF